MVSVQDAFTDAWRSCRIRQGDDPATLPDPLRHQVQQKGKGKRQQRQRAELAAPVDSGGGFFVDEGVLEGGEGESAADEDEEEEEEEQQQQQQSIPEHIPLSCVPDALATLSLPTNDEFVLDLFAQTATYLTTDPRRRRKRTEAAGEDGNEAEKMVSLHDFKRVAEVLLDGEEEQAEESETDEEGKGVEDGLVQSPQRQGERARPIRAAASSANKRRRRQTQLEEEIEEAISDDEDVYAEETQGEEDEDVTSRKPKKSLRLTHKNKAGVASTSRKSTSGGVRRARKQSGKKDETTDEDGGDTDEEGHLNTHQRRQVHAAFQLFTNKLRDLKQEPLDDPPRLSKADLKLLVTSVGEKIPEKEIDEMIEEGLRFFAKASSKSITRQTAKLRREAEAGRATARGETNRAQTVGIDEFAGVLLKGRLI